MAKKTGEDISSTPEVVYNHYRYTGTALTRTKSQRMHPPPPHPPLSMEETYGCMTHLATESCVLCFLLAVTNAVHPKCSKINFCKKKNSQNGFFVVATLMSHNQATNPQQSILHTGKQCHKKALKKKQNDGSID